MSKASDKVPTSATSEQLVQAGVNLAQRALDRFLEGGASDADALLAHASKLVKGLDEDATVAIGKLQTFVDKFKSTPAAPAAPSSPAA